MLWYKLLQNTIYCGKLHFASYQPYKNAGWNSLQWPNKKEEG